MDACRLKMEVETDRTVNYAMQQNSIPVIKKLVVHNVSEESMNDIEILVRSDPAFIIEHRINIDRIHPNSGLELNAVEVLLSHDFLATFAERMVGTIHIVAKQMDHEIASISLPIDVLAYDEWSGLQSCPEMIAAFVTPNNGAIDQILRKASDILEKQTNSSSISGYQTGSPQKAYEIVQAIYLALQEFQIRYSNPPASFEDGQKIRMPDRVLESKLATCLDSSVLFAACAEQAGLNPLVIFKPGHAYVGVWLEDQYFANASLADPMPVRKRVDLRQICVVETTLLTDPRGVPFKQAEETGRRHLDETGFFCAVDVHRARIPPFPIRPLPLRSVEGGIIRTISREDEGDGPTDGMEALDPFRAGEEKIKETPTTRLDKWKRNLLDLTGRNRLLNFKESSGSSVCLSCPGVDCMTILQNVLVEGKSLRVHPMPTIIGPDGKSRTPPASSMKEVVKTELLLKRALSPLGESDLTKHMVGLYRKQKLSMEENGINTIYLAIGFLAYSPIDKAAVRYKAPIILLPLIIERRSARETPSFSLGDDEPMVNATLLELLRRDYGLSISNMDPVPMTEDGAVKIGNILDDFRSAIKEIKGAEVVEEVCIGQFSFAKFLMWRDLQVRSADLKRNKVVTHLLDSPEKDYPHSSPFPDPQRLDRSPEHSPEKTFCVVGADSSQMVAVYSSTKGQSFVLHGPPGTGKSQTITNIIAQNLSMGRTVLFAAEKKAALDVVHRRLEKVGLGPYCLELHSNKANKHEVLKQLKQSLENAQKCGPAEWNDEARHLGELRKELNAYVEAMHRPRENGESIFQAVSDLTALADCRPLKLHLCDGGDTTRERREALHGLADKMRIATMGIDHPRVNVWSTTDYPDYSNSLSGDLVSAITALVHSCRGMEGELQSIAPTLGQTSAVPSLKRLEELEQAAQGLCEFGARIPTRAVLIDDHDMMGLEVDLWTNQGKKRDELRSISYSRFSEDVTSLDVDTIQKELTLAHSSWLTKATVGLAIGTKDEWPSNIGKGVANEMRSLALKCAIAREEIVAAFSTLGLQADAITPELSEKMGVLANSLLDSLSGNIGELLAVSNWEEVRNDVRRLIVIGRERDALRAEVDKRYLREVLSLDLKAVQKDLFEGSNGWFLPKMMSMGRAKKQLKGFAKVMPANIPQTLADLDLCLRLKDAENAVNGANGETIRPFSKEWNKGEADWDRIESIIDHTSELRSAAEQVANVSSLKVEILRERIARALTSRTDRTSTSGWDENAWRKTISSAMEMKESLRKTRAGLDPTLSERWHTMDMGELSSLLQTWAKQFTYLETISAKARPGTFPTYAELPDYLSKLKQLVEVQAFLDGAKEKASAFLGSLWKESEADWKVIDEVRLGCRSLRTVASQIAEDGDGGHLLEAWSKLATEQRMALQENGPTRRTLEAYSREYASLRAAMAVLEELLQTTTASWEEAGQDDLLGRSTRRAQKLREELPKFKAWCHWRAIRRDCMANGLQGLVEAYEEERITSDIITRVFDCSYYTEWVDREISKDAVMRSFSSPEFERRREQFKETDDRFMALTQAEIVAKLATKVPNIGGGNDNSEPGVLRRQLLLQRGHLPVRALFKKIPNLLPKIKPCLLMSPLSITQYLDAAHPQFDLVIFDEASQMPVWDAVGAMARGKEVIIVGDPKQLPPTNFFGRSDTEEDEVDENVVKDLDSVLEDCISSGLPQKRLIWHYRSRHESLIAFSNHYYYDDSLFTFPSPQADTAISYRDPHGTYDRSVTRTNRVEAEAVVKEVVRRLKDPVLSRSSIGIVTFSQVQQKLIEDLLDDARNRNPEIEPHFLNGDREEVFIKNLENVQGDERDVIIFSVCYGPDQRGEVHMSFGPLNRTGGERRLNVAITRARKQILVFSSLRPESIDLSRTRSEGVTHLKYFLEYAIKGVGALAARPTRETDRPLYPMIEESIMEGLVRSGHKVVRNLGCSEYKIDLAIADPERPGEYLLGIECDGANYRSANTARDRDKLREEVLRGLGWNLHRVWATDWWHSPDGEMKKIEEAVAAAKMRRGNVAVSPPEEKQKVAGPQVDPPKVQVVQEPIPELALPCYCAYAVSPIGGQQFFYEYFASRNITNVVNAVAVQEGPILFEVLAKRVCACWDFRRTTKQVKERVFQLLRTTALVTTKEEGTLVIWPPGLDPNGYCTFRVQGEGENGVRKIDEIPLLEVSNAVLHVLRAQIGIPMDDLVREVAAVFDISRVGENVKARIESAVEIQVKRGRVLNKGGQMVLTENG